MTARLLRTQLVVDTCKSHLGVSGTLGTEIESYLTQHILVILCADIQQELYKLLEDRASQAHDRELKDFALSTGKRVLRSISKNEIVGFVGYFGVTAKEFLNKNLDDKDITIYGNALAGRHDVAHSAGTNVTFREIDDILKAARNLISAFEKAIAKDRDKK